MVLQSQIAQRMGIAPWTDEAVMRFGIAMMGAFEAIADMVASDFWQGLRSGISAYETTTSKESPE